jgi:PPOX class probable F420-dependent enzyme
VLEPVIRDLAKGKNFAALTTLGPTGYPQTQVMWVDADDDHVLINTEIERQKAVNVQKDPRVAVMIWDAENAYKYAEVRGNVVDIVRGDRARAHIDELSQVPRQGLREPDRQRARHPRHRADPAALPLASGLRTPSCAHGRTAP